MQKNFNSTSAHSDVNSADLWHNNTVDATLGKLSTSKYGLANREAEVRLLKYGPNKLPAPETRSAVMRFFVTVPQCAYLRITCCSFDNRFTGSLA
jgi:hypothetical protein